MAKKNGGTQAQAPPPAEAPKQKPCFDVRFGRIKAVVWQNESEKGPWYSVQVTRSYRDQKGDWHQAQTFGRDDLLVVSEACRACWHWIVRQKTNGGHPTTAEADNHHGGEEPIPF